MVAILQLFEAFDFIATLIVFFLMYRMFYPELIANKAISLLVTIIVMFVLMIPYPIAKWLAFLGLFGYGFFWGFRPWEWGLTDYDEGSSAFFGKPYDYTEHKL